MLLDKNHRDILVYPYIETMDNIITDTTEGFLLLTGYEKEELISKSLQELRLLLRMNIDIAGVTYESDAYIFTKELEYRNIQIIKGESGSRNVFYYFGEKYNSKLEEKFPAIHQFYIDNIMGIAIFKVPENILLQANQTWLNLMDKPFNNRFNSIGRHISDIIKGWKGSNLEQIWQNMLDTGKGFHSNEHSYKFKKGMTYWNSSLTPVKEGGEIKYAIEIITDTTEKVLQEKKLQKQAAIIRKQNEHMKAMFDNMTDALFIIDKNKKVVLYNKAAREFFYNSNIENVLEEGCKHTKYYDDSNNEIKFPIITGMKILQRESVKHIKLRVERPDKTLYYNVSGSPIYDDEGNIAEALICCNDITEHVLHEEAKRLRDEALIEAEKREKKNLQEVLRLKDEFLCFMSHEFKTPLTVIGAAVQVMEHIYKNQMPDSAFQLIRKIEQNNLRQMRIVNNILDLSRINAGKIKIHKINIDIVFLTRAIVDSVSLFAQQKGVELEFSSTVSQKVIGIDEEKFERILLNLLSNAIKFTSKGKKIVIEFSLKQYRGKEKACIQVKDQGIGICKNKQKIVFERFGQVDDNLSRQAEGTGIGLYLVKTFVEQLNGTIHLKSEEGVGSIFTVIFPANTVADIERGGAGFKAGAKLVESTAMEFSDTY